MKLSVEAKAKYIALCRKLDEEERADGVGPDLTSREVTDEPKQPVPNYQQLQEDAKKQQLKVHILAMLFIISSFAFVIFFFFFEF